MIFRLYIDYRACRPPANVVVFFKMNNMPNNSYMLVCMTDGNIVLQTRSSALLQFKYQRHDMCAIVFFLDNAKKNSRKMAQYIPHRTEPGTWLTRDPSRAGIGLLALAHYTSVA